MIDENHKIRYYKNRKNENGGQTVDKAYLENHPEVMEELDRKVRAHYNLPGSDSAETEGAEVDAGKTE